MAFLHILGIILKVLGFTVLGVLGLVLLLLLFLLLIPIGADFEYIGGEYKLSAKACGILIQLLPKKEKKEGKPKEKKERKKKEKKPKKEKEGEEEKPKEKKALDLTKEEIFELIKKVLGSLKKFGQLTVDRFLLHYTAAGTYVYTVKETMGGSYPGMYAVEGTKTVTVKIKDNNGVLELQEITGVKQDGTMYQVELTNSYNPGVKIGDDTNTTPYFIALGGSGLLLALALLESKRRKAKKETQ